MRDDVRRAALEAAARLTVTMFALGGGAVGCTEPRAPVATADPTPPVAPTDGGVASTPPKVECDTMLKEAFPKPGDYPGTKKDVSEAVRVCCDTMLAKHDSDHPLRWDCCANRSAAGMKDNHLWAACTPWGPPMPPVLA